MMQYLYSMIYLGRYDKNFSPSHSWSQLSCNHLFGITGNTRKKHEKDEIYADWEERIQVKFRDLGNTLKWLFTKRGI
jgi:hypothetical protein